MDTKVLRQKILDLAIRGKLVPQEPNDEPASVLLERIREQKKQMVKEGKLKAKDIKNDTIIFVGEDNLHYEKFHDGTIKCIEDEIPFEVPEGWEWCRLLTVSKDIFAGGDRPVDAVTEADEEHTIPIYSNGMENNGLYGFCSTARVADDAITISARGTIGFSCIRTTPFTPIVRLITIIPEYDIDIQYLKIAIDANTIMSEGSSIPQLTVPGIKPKLIPIPSLKEQVRIVEFVLKAYQFIDSLDYQKRDIQELVTTAKSKILDLAIRGKLVPQDPNDEPASVLLERIRAEKEELIKQGKIKRDKKESIIFKGEDNSYYEKIGDTIKCIDDEVPFELPENWDFIRLKEIWELISGRDLTSSEYNSNGEGIPYITGASNFVEGKVELVRWTSCPQVITKVGDLLITCKGTVGEVAINTFGEAHIARQIMALRTTYDLNTEYLKLCIAFYMNSLKQAAKGLIPGISREDVLNLILPLPATQLQENIVNEVSKLSGTLSAIEKSLS